MQRFILTTIPLFTAWTRAPRSWSFLLTFVAILLFEDPLWMLPVAFLIILQLVDFGITQEHAPHPLHPDRADHLQPDFVESIFQRRHALVLVSIQLNLSTLAIARTMLMILMISAGMILISTTRNEELVLGMIRLGMPYRVGFAISTSLRLVPTIASSTMTISQAQRSRGLDLDSGNLIERIRKFLPLLVPVFISTIRSTNIFGMALESKGFGAREKRTYYLQTENANGRLLACWHLPFIYACIRSLLCHHRIWPDRQGLIHF